MFSAFSFDWFSLNLGMRFITLLLLLTLPVFASAQSKKDKKKYDALIVSGDSAFAAKNYPVAKEKYKQASVIKPKEEYPKTQITLCDQKYVAQTVEYKKLIATADSAFDKKDFAKAKTYYLKANAIKPHDQYSADQAVNCNYQVVAKKAMDERYKEFIRKGDSCFTASNWSCAKSNYQSASYARPEEMYPKQRIIECDKKTAGPLTKERYDLTIADADLQFDSGNYVRAKQLYNEALALDPTSKYAQDRIKSCDYKLYGPK